MVARRGSWLYSGYIFVPRRKIQVRWLGARNIGTNEELIHCRLILKSAEGVSSQKRGQAHLFLARDPRLSHYFRTCCGGTKSILRSREKGA
jgi:hypothetical protein